MRRPRTAPARDPAGRPPTVGLTGPIGAGKSAALAAFARHGAAVLDSDGVVHELYREQGVRRAIAERLGGGVFDSDGSVDRSAVARRVFAEPDLRAWLEALIHPLVARAFERWVMEQAARRPAPRLLVHEVPLLFEADLEHRYDRTLVVVARDETRRERLLARGTLAAIAEREGRLLPIAEKVARADDVIANDGDLGALDGKVVAYLERLGV